jgi:hypothetical protein
MNLLVRAETRRREMLAVGIAVDRERPSGM